MAKSMIAAAVVLFVACGSPARNQTAQQPAVAAPLPTGTLDQLLAPIALYPDQLLAQILMSATNPSKVTELAKWLKSNANLKGTELQDAAVKAGFDASFVALALFPQVVSRMAEQIAWTRVLGQAFTSDRTAVFASIQKLRKQAQSVGTLKSTPQQEVETKKTSSGEQVIIIEPANPQIVYVPQYNTEVVYTQPPSSNRDHSGGRRRRRNGDCGRSHWVHCRYRDWRSHGQSLLLRSIWMARWRLHVQRCVGRLLRPRGKMRARIGWITAKTLSRNAAIGSRTGGTIGRTASRIHKSNAPTASRTVRKTGRPRRPNEHSERHKHRAPRHSGPHRRKAPRRSAPRPRARAGTVVLQAQRLAVIAARPDLRRAANEPARTRSRATPAAHLSAPPALGGSEAAAAAAAHVAAGVGDDQHVWKGIQRPQSGGVFFCGARAC